MWIWGDLSGILDNVSEWLQMLILKDTKTTGNNHKWWGNSRKRLKHRRKWLTFRLIKLTQWLNGEYSIGNISCRAGLEPVNIEQTSLNVNLIVHLIVLLSLSIDFWMLWNILVTFCCLMIIIGRLEILGRVLYLLQVGFFSSLIGFQSILIVSWSVPFVITFDYFMLTWCRLLGTFGRSFIA